MSLKFKSEADNKEADKPLNGNASEEQNIEYHEDKSHVRNICFVETNNKRTSLNYSYLIATEFSPDESAIILTFTTHTVSLKGTNLEKLFESIEKHEPRRIECIDKRYESSQNSPDVVITALTIKTN